MKKFLNIFKPNNNSNKKEDLFATDEEHKDDLCKNHGSDDQTA